MSFIPTLEQVDAFEVPSLLTDRIARIHNVPSDFASGLIQEAKRMLFLSIISNSNVAPSDRIDWAWHEMLMFTQFYKKFGDYIGGFVHHIPNPPPDQDDKEETWDEIQATLGMPRHGSDTYIKTKVNYQKYFGVIPDPLYWP